MRRGVRRGRTRRRGGAPGSGPRRRVDPADPSTPRCEAAARRSAVPGRGEMPYWGNATWSPPPGRPAPPPRPHSATPRSPTSGSTSVWVRTCACPRPPWSQQRGALVGVGTRAVPAGPLVAIRSASASPRSAAPTARRYRVLSRWQWASTRPGQHQAAGEVDCLRGYVCGHRVGDWRTDPRYRPVAHEDVAPRLVTPRIPAAQEDVTGHAGQPNAQGPGRRPERRSGVPSEARWGSGHHTVARRLRVGPRSDSDGLHQRPRTPPRPKTRSRARRVPPSRPRRRSRRSRRNRRRGRRPPGRRTLCPSLRCSSGTSPAEGSGSTRSSSAPMPTRATRCPTSAGTCGSPGSSTCPPGAGPFPAVVLTHGYIDPAIYVNGQGMTREQATSPARGYVVLHTDYRNHAVGRRPASGRGCAWATPRT